MKLHHSDVFVLTSADRWRLGLRSRKNNKKAPVLRSSGPPGAFYSSHELPENVLSHSFLQFLSVVVGCLLSRGVRRGSRERRMRLSDVLFIPTRTSLTDWLIVVVMDLNGDHDDSNGSFASSNGCISTILFDLDNTLIHTRDADDTTIETMTTWLVNKGISANESQKITSDFLQRFREAPAPHHDTDIEGLDEYRRNIWLLALPKKHHELIDEVYSLWKSERLHQLSLKPEVSDMLDDLSSDFNLGLITNGPSVAQWEKITELGCEKYFSSIVVSGDTEVEKPDKDIYNIACDKLHVSPSECIMVGDKIETDILGGVNAGVGATIWINDMNKNEPIAPKPDFTIKDVTQLQDILLTLPTILQNGDS
ncbi:hypothetical protein SK128_020275 [Halocaridina rubra]|uniref:N-acylneuraminate-9-phosphatase n=1 Tax=Halocaridina rubra TaxID=373956 RepID=A0AAN8XRT3_HALRR